MPLFLEHLFERSGAAVVEQGVAAADALQGRGVELVVAHLVDQPHVVSGRRRVLGRDVAGGALPRLEDLAPARHGGRVAVRRPRAAVRAAPVYSDRRSGRRPGRRSASGRAWSSRSTCGPGPPAGPWSRSRSRGRSRRRPAATARAWPRRTSRRPACRSGGRWCGRRCGSYDSSSSRRARPSHCNRAARPGRPRSARAGDPGRSSPGRWPVAVATTEIVSSRLSAT